MKTTVIGITVQSINSGDERMFLIQCDHDNTDLSKFSVGKRVTLHVRDNADEWQWMWSYGTIIASERDKIYIADDWVPKKALCQYDRMDIYVDTSYFDSLRENVVCMLATESWQRKLLCGSLSAAEYRRVCAKPMEDPSFQPNHHDAVRRLNKNCRLATAQLALNESQPKA